MQEIKKQKFLKEMAQKTSPEPQAQTQKSLMKKDDLRSRP